VSKTTQDNQVVEARAAMSDTIGRCEGHA